MWQATLGACVAVLIAVGVRIVAGKSLPSFVPSEESAAPGFALSMTAGYAEEVVFRLAFVPPVYLPLQRHVPRPVAIALTAVATGLLFALLHHVGPGVSTWEQFATRFIIPGAGMTVAFLVIGPAFLVGAHCSAHLLIPALFQ